ncbi:MAG: SDR family NAD(P)-dependent oxidoreductase [Vicinamibacteria bacterium]
MSYLVMGASGGLGRALCYRFAASGLDLVVVSTDERDLEALQSDLKLRYGVRVHAVPADVTRGEEYRERLRALAEGAGPLQGLLFPIGGVLSDDTGGLEPQSAEWLVRVNFLSVVDTVATLLPSLTASGAGVVVGFGSVAAARGRGSNVVYSASKRALESYFESLRHLCANGGPMVQLYVAGYLDTSLSSGRTKLLPKASPERLAAKVLRNLSRDVGLVYFPWYWRPICLALRWTPWCLFKSLKF